MFFIWPKIFYVCDNPTLSRSGDPVNLAIELRSSHLKFWLLAMKLSIPISIDGRGLHLFQLPVVVSPPSAPRAVVNFSLCRCFSFMPCYRSSFKIEPSDLLAYFFRLRFFYDFSFL